MFSQYSSISVKELIQFVDCYSLSGAAVQMDSTIENSDLYCICSHQLDFCHVLLATCLNVVEFDRSYVKHVGNNRKLFK